MASLLTLNCCMVPQIVNGLRVLSACMIMVFAVLRARGELLTQPPLVYGIVACKPGAHAGGQEQGVLGQGKGRPSTAPTGEAAEQAQSQEVQGEEAVAGMSP